MPMGPITLYDLVGLDTAVYAGMVMYEAFPDRVVASPLVPAMVKQGRLGQKIGPRLLLATRTRRAGPRTIPALDEAHRTVSPRRAQVHAATS